MASRVTSTRFVGRDASSRSCARRSPRRRRPPVARVRRGRVRASARPGCWPSSSARRASGGRARDRRRVRRARRGRAAVRAARRRAAAAGPRRRRRVRRASRAARAALAQILPGLGARRPRAPTTRRPRRRGCSRRCSSCCERLGGRGRPAADVEDLHWADRSTRAFLAYLAASLCRERVLVVTTYRPDELHRRHPLRPLLAELERDARARRVELRAAHARRAGRAAQRHPRRGAARASCSTACSRARRATRCSPRSCSRPGPTGAARSRRRCATR